MSKLDELMENLCPNGVVYKKLIDLCTVLKKGTLKTSELIHKGTYPVVNSGREFYGFYNQYNNEGDAITFAARGEYAGFVNYLNTKFWAGGLCYPYRSKDEKIIKTKFIYYYLKNIENTIMRFLVARGSIPAINKKDIDNILLPVPPLEIQDKIIYILDHFTSLSEQLSVELKARQKQYGYYREKMLKFSSNDSNIRWVNLGTYCKRLTGTAITAGKMKEIAKEDGTLKIFAGGKTVITTDENNIPKEDIIKVPNIIVQSRGIIDFIYYDKYCSYKREMWSYTNDNIVTLKYIYYYLKSNVQFFRQRGSQMGSMPQISLDITEKYKIPIPKYEEQEKIVNILDKFDKLCNDILEGLPAEIEARQKQYEYYRNKLLTFKKLK